MNELAICTTTINPPSEALKRFAAFKNWDLVVALDTNSSEFHLDGAIILDIEDQINLSPRLSEAIGFNTIQRRNFAHLWALREGYKRIAFVDDDNIPQSNWEAIAEEEYFLAMEFETSLPIFDPLATILETQEAKVAHRGVPINQYGHENTKPTSLKTLKIKPDITAMLWDGDWDVNAVDRIHRNCNGTLTVQNPFFCNTAGPFNSQNTVISATAAKDYFLLPFVGRFDDILASYILRLMNYSCVYTEPTVTQIRNPHLLYRDISNETWGYHYLEEILCELQSGKHLSDLEIIPKRTKKALEIWNSEIERIFQ